MFGSSFWPRSRKLVAALAVFALLPATVSEAGWLSDLFKGSSKPVAQKPTPSSKPAATSKPQAEKQAAEKPLAEKSRAPQEGAAKCEPAKLRIAVDVGHTRESDGAMSARNVPEYNFNLNLARKVADRLKSEGFSETRLLITDGKAWPSLLKRVAAANRMEADLFLSIHHDSVPDKFKEKWEFEGKKLEYSDRFSGYSLFVSRDNPSFETSMQFAKLIGRQMKAKGLKYAEQYSLPIMGRYRHDLLDRDVGIYDHDAIPGLMNKYLPTGVLGVAITGLLAAFMAGMAANISSFNAVWTYDIWQNYIRPGRPDRYYLQVGRYTTIAGVVVGIGTAFLAAGYSNINNYIQTLFSFFNVPIFLAFIVGMFWKGAGRSSGFWGMLVGTITSFGIFVLYQAGVIPFRSDLGENQWAAIISFLVGLLAMVIATRFGEAKTDEELEGLVYGRQTVAVSTTEHHGIAALVRSPVALGALSLALCVIAYAYIELMN